MDLFGFQVNKPYQILKLASRGNGHFANHVLWKILLFLKNTRKIFLFFKKTSEEYVVSQKPRKNIFYSSKILLRICCFSKILLGIWCFSKSLWKVSFISQKSSEKYFLFPKNPPKNFLFFSKKNPSNSCATLRIVSFRLNSCFFRQALIVDKCRFLQRCFYHRSNFMWGHWRWYVLHQHLKIFFILFCGSTGVDMFFINRSVKEACFPIVYEHVHIHTC